MSNLTEFLIAHQQSLGLMYTPVMTLYMFAIISPVWSAYLLVCSFLSLAPTARYPRLADVCLYIRLSSDALLNPCSLVLYWYFLPYYFAQSDNLFYFFYQNRSGALSIKPLVYFTVVFVLYMLLYWVNTTIYKRIKPGIDFNKEYLMTFYSPSRLFGSAGLLIVLFDFDVHIAYLLWCNIYIGVVISVVRYALSLRHAYNTSSFLMTSR